MDFLGDDFWIISRIQRYLVRQWVHAASVVWGRARRRQRQWPFVAVLLVDGDTVVFGCNSGFWTAPSLSPVRKPCASGPCWSFSTTSSSLVSGLSQPAGCRLLASCSWTLTWIVVSGLDVYSGMVGYLVLMVTLVDVSRAVQYAWDVYRDELAVVPPGVVDALRGAVSRLWVDDFWSIWSKGAEAGLFRAYCRAGGPTAAGSPALSGRSTANS